MKWQPLKPAEGWSSRYLEQIMRSLKTKCVNNEFWMRAQNWDALLKLEIVQIPTRKLHHAKQNIKRVVSFQRFKKRKKKHAEISCKLLLLKLAHCNGKGSRELLLGNLGAFYICFLGTSNVSCLFFTCTLFLDFTWCICFAWFLFYFIYL